MSDPLDLLARARAAIEHGDDAAALRELRAAWAMAPHPTIGDAIEVVGARAARGVAAPGGDSRTERDLAWKAALASRDPVVLHHLLETVNEQSPPERYLALASTGDPRVAHRLARVLGTHLSYVERVSVLSRPDRVISTVWRPLYAMFVASRDRRVHALLSAGMGYIVGRAPPAQRLRAKARLAAVLDQLERACAEAPVPSDAAIALASAIANDARAPHRHERDDPAREAALLADIYRAPADDGPRAVYADWLLERGHPRGELISLQLLPGYPASLSPPQRERVNDLIDHHGRAFLGSLEPYIASGARFARGFVATCTIPRGTKVPADPAWATVTSVEYELPATDAHPMPDLRAALGLSLEGLAHLARLTAPPPLVTLGWSGHANRRAEDAEIESRTAAASFAAVLPRLPTLRTLVLHDRSWIEGGIGPHGIGWPWRDAPLDELDVAGALRVLPAWFDAIERSHLRAFTLRDALYFGWIVRIARDAAGAWSHVTIDTGAHGNTLAQAVDGIAPLVERMPTLVHFEMKVPAVSAWTAALRRRIASALELHPELAHRAIRGLP